MTSTRAQRIAAAGLIGVASLPLLIALVRLLIDNAGDDHLAWADVAVTEWDVRRVGTEELLLGVYSRFGWRHPGPAMFYLLAPLYRLLGSTSLALAISATALNLASWIAIGLLLLRRGGLALTAMGMALLSVPLATLGADLLMSAWNPYLTLLPLVVLVLLAWCIAQRELWAVPTALGVASFLVQTHVGYTPIVVASLATASVYGAIAIRRSVRASPTWLERQRPRLVRIALASGAVLAVLWAPTIFDELFRTGNLGDVVSFFSTSDSAWQLDPALKLVSNQLSWEPEWIFGPLPFFLGILVPARVPIPIAFLALVGATVWSARSGSRAATRFGVLVIVLDVVAVIAVARVDGIILPYLIRWIWLLGPLTWLAAAWALASTLDRRQGDATSLRPDGVVNRIALGLGTALLIAMVVVISVDAVRTPGPGPEPARSDQIALFTDAILERLPSRDEPVLLIPAGAFEAPPMARSVALQLDKRGIRARLPARDADVVGEDHTWPGTRIPPNTFVFAETTRPNAGVVALDRIAADGLVELYTCPDEENTTAPGARACRLEP